MTDPFVRPAVQGDVDAICNLLHTKMDQKISPTRWRRLMQYQWMANKPDFGRVVDYSGEVLGYLGMVYADRIINQQTRTTVSLSGWYLDKSMRGRGLGKALMVDAIHDESMIYTMITVSSKVTGLVREIGYQVLDENRFIWRKKADHSQQLSVVSNPDEILSELFVDDQQIFLDHASLPVMPLLIKHKNDQTLLYFSVKKKAGGVLYYDVLCSSNRSFLLDYGQELANALLVQQPSVLAADCRFVEGKPVGARLERFSVPRYFKAAGVSAKDIDYLYTELLLLDLKLD